MTDILPAYVTPDQVADHFGVSERTIRDMARQLGACATIGKKMILLKGHVNLILEATQSCQSNSTSAKAGKSGTSGAQYPVGDFAALQGRLTKTSQKGSRRKPKQKPGNVVLMDRERG